jgi:PEP-CTERM motif
MRMFIVSVLLSMVSLPVFANPLIRIPEPTSLGLIGVGVAAALVLARRKKQ